MDATTARVAAGRRDVRRKKDAQLDELRAELDAARAEVAELRARPDRARRPLPPLTPADRVPASAGTSSRLLAEIRPATVNVPAGAGTPTGEPQRSQGALTGK